MSKRFWINAFIFMIVMILLYATFIFLMFSFPLYRSFFLGTLMFLSAGTMWFSGTQQKKAAIISKQPILPWWKNYLTIFALSIICFGSLYCFIGLSEINKNIENLFESIIGDIFIILFIIVFFCLSIYGITLAIQHIAAQRLRTQNLRDGLEKSKQSGQV